MPSLTLVTTDLDAALRISYGSDGDCRDAASISVIGDINGDDRVDIAVFFSPAEGYGPGLGAVVFGGLTSGLVNVQTLDGQNGFILGNIVPAGFYNGLTSPGDLNADGFDDVLFKNSIGPLATAWHVMEGRAGFPDSRSSGEVDEGEILLSLEFEGRLILESGIDTLKHEFDTLNGDAGELVLSVVDNDGTALAQSVRRVSAFEPIETLSTTIYGARLLQI